MKSGRMRDEEALDAGDAGNLRRKTENLTEENETKTGDAPSKLYIRE